MDFSELLNKLNNATLFDLYRLSTAINKELENPERKEQVRRLLKVGDTISYFASEENRLIKAKILEIKRTRALVQNKHDMKKWDIPFYMFNVDDISVDITCKANSKGISRHEIRIGDLVGFQDRDNNNLRGKVIRINPKTVTILVEPDQKWRVSYSMLHPIVDGQTAGQQFFIEGTVIECDSD